MMAPRTTLIGLLSIALMTSFCFAQTDDLDWAEKMFEKHNIDFGTVAKGADVRMRVKITNLYKEDVHISQVTTTCGCSAASPSQRSLKSKETAYVEVTMDTHRFSRRKDSNLIVVFDLPYQAEVRIPITAYIRTDVVLTPGSVNFGAVQQGLKSERKLTLSYAGREDWRIQEIVNKNKSLDVRFEQTSRGGGYVNYDLYFTLKDSAKVGNFREQVLLVTDDANTTGVPVLVEATVESDVTVTPPIVSLGMLAPGEKKTVNVVIRSQKAFTIEKIECESKLECFQVRLPKKAQTVHVLPLTITPPNRPGALNETFTVTIADRPEPVTFQAYGQVLDSLSQSAKNVSSH